MSYQDFKSSAESPDQQPESATWEPALRRRTVARAMQCRPGSSTGSDHCENITASDHAAEGMDALYAEPAVSQYNTPYRWSAGTSFLSRKAEDDFRSEAFGSTKRRYQLSGWNGCGNAGKRICVPHSRSMSMHAEEPRYHRPSALDITRLAEHFINSASRNCCLSALFESKRIAAD